MRYKVLSVKQPWAYLICSGIKDIENRTWKCPQKYIGQRVLIHASGAKAQFHFSNAHYEKFRELNEKFRELNMRRWYDNDFYKSAIIGSVEIVDCVINHSSIWAERAKKDPWYEYIHSKRQETRQVYNWVLANPILFEKPIFGVNGKLGFWEF